MIAIAFLFTWSALALLWHAVTSNQKRLRHEDTFLEKDILALRASVTEDSEEMTKLLESNDELRQEFKNLKFSLGLKTPKRKTKKSN